MGIDDRKIIFSECLKDTRKSSLTPFIPSPKSNGFLAGYL